MKKQEFRTEDLKVALEQITGRKLKPLSRLGGGGAINFRAVQKEDESSYIVKCYPPHQAGAYDRLKANLMAMAGAKVPELLFTDRYPLRLANHWILCLSWCAGLPDPSCRFAHQRSGAFLEDYRSLSNRMQMVECVGPAWPIRDWKYEILRRLRGHGRRLLSPVLEAMSDADLERNPDRMRIIHGDFHTGNALFADGRLEGFLDFENLRFGYPTEDLTCFCIDAAKRSRWFERDRRQGVFSFFAQAVRQLPYSAHEWRTAINALFFSKLMRKVNESPDLDWLTCVKFMRRAKMDDRFRAIATESEGCR